MFAAESVGLLMDWWCFCALLGGAEEHEKNRLSPARACPTSTENQAVLIETLTFSAGRRESAL